MSCVTSMYCALCNVLRRTSGIGLCSRFSPYIFITYLIRSTLPRLMRRFLVFSSGRLWRHTKTLLHNDFFDFCFFSGQCFKTFLFLWLTEIARFVDIFPWERFCKQVLADLTLVFVCLLVTKRSYGNECAKGNRGVRYMGAQPRAWGKAARHARAINSTGHNCTAYTDNYLFRAMPPNSRGMQQQSRLPVLAMTFADHSLAAKVENENGGPSALCWILCVLSDVVCLI